MKAVEDDQNGIAWESKFIEELHWVRIAIRVLEQRSEIRPGKRDQNRGVTS